MCTSGNMHISQHILAICSCFHIFESCDHHKCPTKWGSEFHYSTNFNQSFPKSFRPWGCSAILLKSSSLASHLQGRHWEQRTDQFLNLLAFWILLAFQLLEIWVKRSSAVCWCLVMSADVWWCLVIFFSRPNERKKKQLASTGDPTLVWGWQRTHNSAPQ